MFIICLNKRSPQQTQLKVSMQLREEPFKFLTHSPFFPDVWPQVTGDETAYHSEVTGHEHPPGVSLPLFSLT